MTPLIDVAVGHMTYPVGQSPAKRLLARGTQHFSYSAFDTFNNVAVCFNCCRSIVIARDTPWAEVDAIMDTHRHKFCLGRIERANVSY